MFIRSRAVFAPDDEQGTPEPQGLSIDEAVSKLGEMRTEAAKVEKTEKKEPEAKTPDPVRDTPDASADDGEPGDDSGDEPDLEKLAAAVEQEPTTVPDTALPPGWAETERALFESLTPEAQAKLVAREKQRDAGIRKQLQATETAKKAAEEAIAHATAERQKLGPALQSTEQFILQQIVRDFPDVNPKDPNSLMQLALTAPERKVAFDALWQQLGQTVGMRREHESRMAAEQEAEYGKFADARVSKLLELDNTLSDPAKATAFETEIVGFLHKDNPYGSIAPERIKHYSAEELLLARDAYRYRKAMAALKTKPKTEVPKVVKSGAPVEGGKTGEVAALEKQHRKGGSIDTGLALLRARRAAN